MPCSRLAMAAAWPHNHISCTLLSTASSLRMHADPVDLQLRVRQSWPPPCRLPTRMLLAWPLRLLCWPALATSCQKLPVSQACSLSAAGASFGLHVLSIAAARGASILTAHGCVRRRAGMLACCLSHSTPRAYSVK